MRPVAPIIGYALFAATLLTAPNPVPAQQGWPFGPPPPMAVPQTPQAQRNELNNVRSQANWVLNSTRTAQNYATGAVEMVWQQFQNFRASYETLKMTLNPRQITSGANELAELDAGLDIIQEVFANYQQDIAAGRPPAAALRDLCHILGQGVNMWVQQLNRDANRLRVGW